MGAKVDVFRSMLYILFVVSIAETYATNRGAVWHGIDS